MYVYTDTHKHKNLQLLKLDANAAKSVMTNKEITIYPVRSA